jgi:hypothetical protein
MVEPVTAATAAAAATATAGTAATTSVGAATTGAVHTALTRAAVNETLAEIARTAVKQAEGAVLGAVAQEVLSDSPELQQLASLAIRTGAARLEGVASSAALRPQFELQRWLSAETLLAKPVIQPLDIVERFRDLRANLKSVSEHLMSTDAELRRMVELETARQTRCLGPGDLDSAVHYLSKRPAGLLAEKLVQAVFEPLFDSTMPQVRAILTDSYSIVDHVFEGAKRTIVFNAQTYVQQGGNLLAEVKTGKADYLLGQLEHLTNTQIPGHQVFEGTSIVVTCSDFYDLGGLEIPFRAAIRAEGSQVLTFLPKKETIDSTLREFVQKKVAG